MPSPDPANDWPGKRLGLPAAGPRSIGRLGRRIAALAIDWAAAVLISVAFFQYDLLLGMRVVPVSGGYLGWWRPFARTALLCLVIPAVIWDRDQRGMHDRLIGTVLVRR